MRCSRAGLDFQHVGQTSLRYLPLLVLRWLPDGRREGHEWVARNPTRSDRALGSFKINLRTGNPMGIGGPTAGRNSGSAIRR